jgi:hypothetical protein
MKKKPVRYLPDNEVVTFAQGILANRYFLSTDVHKSDIRSLSTIFLPLLFLDKAGIKKMQNDGVVVLYEEMRKRVGTMSINGYPCFGSVRMLTRADWEKVRGALAVIEGAIKQAAASYELSMKEANPEKSHGKESQKGDVQGTNQPEEVGGGTKES